MGKPALIWLVPKGEGRVKSAQRCVKFYRFDSELRVAEVVCRAERNVEAGAGAWHGFG
jgi:hypothetical protein